MHLHTLWILLIGTSEKGLLEAMAHPQSKQGVVLVTEFYDISRQCRKYTSFPLKLQTVTFLMFQLHRNGAAAVVSVEASQCNVAKEGNDVNVKTSIVYDSDEVEWGTGSLIWI